MLEVDVYASGCMLNSVVDLQPMLIPVEISGVQLGESRERGDMGWAVLRHFHPEKDS